MRWKANRGMTNPPTFSGVWRFVSQAGRPAFNKFSIPGVTENPAVSIHAFSPDKGVRHTALKLHPVVGPFSALCLREGLCSVIGPTLIRIDEYDIRVRSGHEISLLRVQPHDLGGVSGGEG